MTEAYQLVYKDMVAKHGMAYARRYFQGLGKARVAQTSQEVERTKFAKQAKAALQNAVEASKPTGEQAIRLAQDITAHDKQALGVSYPLVLACVAAALEAGHNPDDQRKCNSYHMGITYDTLGWMSARAEGRETPYCTKTIQRWLSKDARHADKLREWLAWRPWYTDTLQNYSTGESIGPVIGCHVVRVNTVPLKGSRLSLLGDWLRKQWRNLQAEIKAGRTSRARSASRTAVHIDRRTLRDAQAANFYMSDWQQHPPGEKAGPLSEHYIYPDIKTPSGVAQLRTDVRTAAFWLAKELGELPTQISEMRYLNAVWAAVKHDVVNGDSGAKVLLMQAVKLSHELNSDPTNTLKNKASYIWSLIEDRGFREYRRDAPARLFNKSLFKQVVEF